MPPKNVQTDQVHSSEPSDGYILSYSPVDFAKLYGFSKGEEWTDSDMDMDSFGLCIGLYKENTQCQGVDMSKYKINLQQQHFVDFESTKDMHLKEFGNIVCMESEKTEVIEPEKMYMLPSASFNILKKYESRSRKLQGEKMNIPTYETERTVNSSQTPLPIENIIQLAAEKFIQSASQVSTELSTLSHPYPCSILCQSKEDSEGVQLVQNLLSSAEKTSEKLYAQASKLLHECDRMSSPVGSTVQRLAYYFTEALYEKIDRETGRITPQGLGKKVNDPIEAVQGSDATTIAFHKELPVSQITKFAGIQAVLDNIGDAKKIHFVDFEIRKGIHCTILMQALLTRIGNPIEHLKITAVGTKSRTGLEETGRQLVSFAQSLNLKFSFSIVMVDDILDLNENLFEMDAEEAIVVYAAFFFTFMIGRPDKLDHVLRVIRAIKPCVMVVTEVDANCNSPIFIHRFVEALFFYGAFFESMAESLRKDEEHRRIAESTSFGSAIRNVVAVDGEERKIRHVSLDVWRAFFTRFGFKETELSMSSMYQAKLVLGRFFCADSFTFDTDDKSLIIGWKGTPFSSLSAWKF